MAWRGGSGLAFGSDGKRLGAIIIARVASTQGNHASLMASAQKAKGFHASIERAKASKEGTAVRLIETCSVRPSGE